MKLPYTILSVLVVLATCDRLQAQYVDFDRDIEPIFNEHCLHCHGADEQESGLRLDHRVSMLRGGDSGQPVIVPGKPAASFLLQVINHLDENLRMPPDEDKIPAEQIALVSRWITEGAVWPGQMDAVVDVKSDHWSFQSVVRPEVPIVALHADQNASNTGQLSRSERQLSPIDAFLLERLRKEGLTFSRRADARTLIRRVSIVLTGLAPTSEEVDAFTESYARHPDIAYEQLVDRLLDTPHFGERWAQHWLDVIRWAETNGSEANLYRKNSWVYRDYVIRSFNEDKPYDQFVSEQLAGDTMGSGEATGFLVAGPHVPAATVGQEPTAIRLARADRMDEILQTVGASMLGLTVGCARCHNHKFDPISIADYYSLNAIFADIEFGSRFPEFSAEHPRRQRGQNLWAEINKQRRVLRDTGPWEEDWGGYRELHFAPVETRAVRVSFKTSFVGVDELELFGPANPRQNLALKSRGTAVTGADQMATDGRNEITRVNDGEYGTMAWRARSPKDSKDRPWARFDFTQPHQINRLRISSNREYFFETDYLTVKSGFQFKDYDVEILDTDGQWRSIASTEFIKNKLNQSSPTRAAAVAELARLSELLAEEGPRPSFVGRFVEPVQTHVLHRGSPENPTTAVMPAAPVILSGDLDLDSESSGPERRARFAQWITQPTHPLTSRVMVNRIWQHVFGAGIVSTAGDFGSAGAAPTHPKLLDWLAAEFVQPTVGIGSAIAPNRSAARNATIDGAIGDDPAAKTTIRSWSIKSMIRLLVTSEAFRQSSKPTEEGKDASAALLWRYPPRRVEAEVIRDSILQATGSLDRTMGGRGYRIHNVKKTYAQWEVVNNHGPETWRRMIYQERMRRVDDRMFTAFDFPDCGQVRAKRPVSTTPLQALNLMNSDFVIEQSSKLAELAVTESGGDEAEAVDRCFQRLLGRLPDTQERMWCHELAKEHQLNIVCRAIINSNEFSFLP